MSEDHVSDAGTARSFDPERGAFDPPQHPPLDDPESNPRGVRHVGETAQDRMPVGDRPRYKDAQERRARMVVAASRRLKKATGRVKAPSAPTPR